MDVRFYTLLAMLIGHREQTLSDQSPRSGKFQQAISSAYSITPSVRSLEDDDVDLTCCRA